MLFLGRYNERREGLDQGSPRVAMHHPKWGVFMEEHGKVHVVEMTEGTRKIKGLGVLDPMLELASIDIGQQVLVGQKILTRLPLRLPELNRGMVRRAQTISAKDAGFFITRMGLGAGDTVLEAGIGSAGLSMHIARVIGQQGKHITVEPRSEHAEVGLENLRRAKESWLEFPEHHHLEGRIEEVIPHIKDITATVDAIVLDLPEHPSAIQAVAELLAVGGRLACYCPVSQQLEQAWVTCEEVGLTVEWAGELMEREWGRAAKGGMRPVNGPFGHTAFLLLAQRNRVIQ